MGKFYNWIANNFQGPVILVAHGAFSKHARFLVEDFQSTGYKNDRIESIIVGFSDTLVAFPEYFKGVCCIFRPAFGCCALHYSVELIRFVWPTTYQLEMRWKRRRHARRDEEEGPAGVSGKKGCEKGVLSIRFKVGVI